MLNIKNSFHRFHSSLNQRVPSNFIDFLRISVGLILLVQMFFIWDQASDLFGERGLVQKEISDFFANSFLNLRLIADILSWSVPKTLTVVLWLYVSLLVTMILGLLSRVSSIGVWLLHHIVFMSAPLTFYGIDNYASVFLFYLAILPSNRNLSIDKKWGLINKKQSRTVPYYCRLTIQIHLAITYVDAGLSKAMGASWWNGEAIYRALMLPEFQQMDFSWFHYLPWVPLIIGLATLFLEVFYPFIMFHPRLRKYGLVGIIGMHLGIALFQGLHLFALLMICLNIASFSQAIQNCKKVRIPCLVFTNHFLPRWIKIKVISKPI